MIIDSEILLENVREVVEKTQEYEWRFGVVKGDGYGHGYGIVSTLIDGGVNYLAVATVSEGEKAVEAQRGAAKKLPILVLEPLVEDSDFETAKKNGLAITISSMDGVERAVRNKFSGRVHFKINAGMNRFGFSSGRELRSAVEMIKKVENIEIEGVFAHFSTDGMFDGVFSEQVKKMREILGEIPDGTFRIRHFYSSRLLETQEKLAEANGVRIGALLYGIKTGMPSYLGAKGAVRKLKHQVLFGKTAKRVKDFKVAEAFNARSEIIDIQTVREGGVVGYNPKKVEREIRVGALPIGYADGVSLKMRGGEVVILGRRCRIITMSMDSTIVEVPKKAKIGDEAVIIGGGISGREVARRLGLPMHAVYTMFNRRALRVMK